jgi:hypothetical protein
MDSPAISLTTTPVEIKTKFTIPDVPHTATEESVEINLSGPQEDITFTSGDVALVSNHARVFDSSELVLEDFDVDSLIQNGFLVEYDTEEELVVLLSMVGVLVHSQRSYHSQSSRPTQKCS